jgi:hypothetical protein
MAARQRADAAGLSISARLVDPVLPDLPFRTWLQTVVGDAKTYADGPICQDIPDPTGVWNFCAEATATTSDGRIVTVALDASVVRDRARLIEYKPISARFSAAYINDGRPGRVISTRLMCQTSAR